MDQIDPAVLAFDIDGVVADTMQLFLKIAREEHGIHHIVYTDITCYMLEECLDIDGGTLMAILEKIVDGSRDDALDPIPGSLNVLRRMNGVPIHFVTARSNRRPIEKWLTERCGLPASRLIIDAVGSFEAKTDVLIESGRQFFVEDRLETCFQLHEAGITPILFQQPWNRAPHPFVEVASWQGLAGLIHLQ